VDGCAWRGLTADPEFSGSAIVCGKALAQQFPILIPALHILLKVRAAPIATRGANLNFVVERGRRQFFHSVFWHDPQAAEDNR
jgi:hypothetical protein